MTRSGASSSLETLSPKSNHTTTTTVKRPSSSSSVSSLSESVELSPACSSNHNNHSEKNNLKKRIHNAIKKHDDTPLITTPCGNIFDHKYSEMNNLHYYSKIEQRNLYMESGGTIRKQLLHVQHEEIVKLNEFRKRTRSILAPFGDFEIRQEIEKFSYEDTLSHPYFLGRKMVLPHSSGDDETDEESGHSCSSPEVLVVISCSSDEESVNFDADSDSEQKIWIKVENQTVSWSSSSSEEEVRITRSSKRKKLNNAKKKEVNKPEPCVYSPIVKSSDIFGNNSTLLLKDYQIEGVNFLYKNFCEKRNSCLGHEMGLGKTIISLSALNIFHKKLNLCGPFLVVVPLITLGNWVREANTWIPHFVIHTAWGTKMGGSKDESLDSLNSIFKECAAKRKPLLVITTYELFKERKIKQKKWSCVIFDEAHRLKSRATKWRAEAETLKTDRIILLTGTPMQNNTEELWSLLRLIAPSKFPSFDDFTERFGDLETENYINELKTAIAPYILRRTKAQVLVDELPPKEEIIVEVELTSFQKAIYRAIVEKKASFLRRKFSSTQDLSNMIMSLRKCCNHPCLISGMENYLREEENKDDKAILVYSSSKMVLVHKLLKKFRDANEKVLILSQFLDMLDILEDYLTMEQIEYVRIDGGTSSEEREENIKKFQNDSECRVFLMSTKVGQGVNLTAANHVIIYDSDFNPFNDSQAAARCHRIGQQKKVFVYRLITKDSYEKYIILRASKKLGKEKVVLADNMCDQIESLSSEELERMIRYGVYHMFLNKSERDNTNKDSELANADIEKILQESNKVNIQEENEGALVSKMNALTQCDVLLKKEDKMIIDEESKQVASSSRDTVEGEASTSNEQASSKKNDNEVITSAYFVPIEEVATDVSLNDEHFWEKAFPDYCDIPTLERRLFDPKPFEAHEFANYFEKLSKLVLEMLGKPNLKTNESSSKGKDLGEYLENEVTTKVQSHNKHQLHTFLLNLNAPNFNPHYYSMSDIQKETIQEWLGLIETKTLRNRKTWHQEHAPQKSSSNSKYVEASESSNENDNTDEDFQVDEEELAEESAQLQGMKKKKKKKKKTDSKAALAKKIDVTKMADKPLQPRKKKTKQQLKFVMEPAMGMLQIGQSTTTQATPSQQPPQQSRPLQVTPSSLLVSENVHPLVTSSSVTNSIHTLSNTSTTSPISSATTTTTLSEISSHARASTSGLDSSPESGLSSILPIQLEASSESTHSTMASNHVNTNVATTTTTTTDYSDMLSINRHALAFCRLQSTTRASSLLNTATNSVTSNNNNNTSSTIHRTNVPRIEPPPPPPSARPGPLASTNASPIMTSSVTPSAITTQRNRTAQQRRLQFHTVQPSMITRQPQTTTSTSRTALNLRGSSSQPQQIVRLMGLVPNPVFTSSGPIATFRPPPTVQQQQQLSTQNKPQTVTTQLSHRPPQQDIVRLLQPQTNNQQPNVNSLTQLQQFQLQQQILATLRTQSQYMNVMNNRSVNNNSTGITNNTTTSQPMISHQTQISNNISTTIVCPPYPYMWSQQHTNTTGNMNSSNQPPIHNIQQHRNSSSSPISVKSDDSEKTVVGPPLTQSRNNSVNPNLQTMGSSATMVPPTTVSQTHQSAYRMNLERLVQDQNYQLQQRSNTVLTLNNVPNQQQSSNQAAHTIPQRTAPYKFEPFNLRPSTNGSNNPNSR
ncbi:hypothetical protein C9374_001145 [Naegleria lovaniensis]|uniref:Uncharacterized protein n=1 Tax=Naegleria lovaniensis TaxID=51637 RepID=A0AA88KNH0_NAELO|nr:uncharacterized protein C9374_001145 [Naegleria lovaniensis]KAG2387551.1 hypothetical protein C9374_001145 [Naegleria lovaniensis]